MDRFNYNPMLKMLWNLKPNIMVIADFGNWDETEDNLIKKAVEINLTMNNKLSLGLMNMVSYQQFDQAILSQEAITLDAEANDAAYYINYVVDKPMAGQKQADIFKNMKSLLNVQEVVIRNDFQINGELIELNTLNDVFGQDHVHVLDGIKEHHSIDALKDMLAKGDVRAYREETGISWSFKAPVVKGKGLGKELGFATANQTPEFELPIKHGVYFTQVKLPNEEETHSAMTCYWKNEKGIDTVETHIFDFDKDIYGYVIEVFFEEWVRDLRPLTSKNAITTALEKDEEFIRNHFLIEGEND